ncbi:hypothetical protein NEOLI_001673 [Neolecta irregularis DAH-3]|uniref:Uncharacterized protein n=1 Tax=Neolecta irregularis (strain DAH-3) TaxID=1198029 RepID=A0A1U7LRL5_NEOID|nr:hypothetical protein NEOLI_001673 [Neolecta irregularis DAH-3]|eukprot:OLL25223.1 hypothetical protein NEOLI_001673 [Neolecta irregularis DAH-3]
MAVDLMVIPRSCAVKRGEHQSNLFVLPRIGKAGGASLFSRDDTGSLDKGVSESRLAMVDMGNDGHVPAGSAAGSGDEESMPHISGLVHETTDLLDGESNHDWGV